MCVHIFIYLHFITFLLIYLYISEYVDTFICIYAFTKHLYVICEYACIFFYLACVGILYIMEMPEYV